MKEMNKTKAIIQQKAKAIKLLVLDVDGVLTDRKIYLADSGHEYKAFNSLDGFGIKMLLKTGVQVAIITTRNSPVVQRRMHELGVKHVYQGQEDKNLALQDLVSALNLTLDQVAYVGDDLPDLPLMRKVGIGIAVADAASYVLQHADWVTRAKGGKGAVREVCELIMEAQQTLARICEQYL